MTNLATVLINFGIFAIAYIVWKNSVAKAQKKAMDKKADVEYVNDKVAVLHGMVDESNEKQKENFDLLLWEIRESKKDIKEILGKV